MIPVVVPVFLLKWEAKFAPSGDRLACRLGYADGRLSFQVSAPIVDRAAYKAFTDALREGRRAIYRPEGTPFALYTDPRPGGAQLTLEWLDGLHATCGATLSRREIGAILEGTVGSGRRGRPADHEDGGNERR